MKLSLSTKLTSLIVVSMALVVGVITGVQSSRQVDEIERQIEDKADVYGQLAATQLESAIAFRDVLTAREVLESLGKDADVAGAMVYAADGSVLLHVGNALPSERATDDARHVIPQPGRVVAIAPIVSKEGPRGSVVIELASARSDREARSALVTAILTGLAMLAAGGVVAWLMTRTIARRVSRLTDVAEVLAEGYLDVTPPYDPSSDEVGRLARAFDTMVVRLRGSFDETRKLSEQRRAAIQQANLDLERRVDLRTRELRRANGKLQHEIEERNRIEIELRQAQKLEAVGRLAAGVAHELNTPIQFVTDSCTFIDDAAKAFISSIQGARDGFDRLATTDSTPADEVQRFARELETADFEYLAEQVPLAVTRALEGLERLATIVSSMKAFSHPDQTEKTQGDINRGILATLEIARNEYKYVADVTTDLAELPTVMCHIGELNQAFLNIIVNAAHAIGDATRDGERGKITVKTWDTGTAIAISFSDTGRGIPAEIRDRIFDPFFTTKEVGKGTGQGLAIARSVIVDKHGGNIGVDSEVGRGTTFTLTVPYRDESIAASVAASVAA